MKKFPANLSRLITNQFKPRAQRLRLFQAFVVAVIILILGIFLVNYPAGLSSFRFGATIAGLLFLLGLNVAGIEILPRSRTTSTVVKDWLFLIFSVLLILGVVGSSGQYDLVYLLSLVCAQADANQNVWPGGVIFGITTLLAWFGLQLAFQVPLTIIIGREFALAVGIVFGFVVVILLQRTTLQTEHANALLAELQVANRELVAARQKEKELAVAEERLRLARDLHDSVTQLLYSVSLFAEAAIEQLNAGFTDTATINLHELQDTSQAALREMRLLIFELRGPVVTHEGLVAAIRDRLNAVETRGGLETHFKVEGEENLSDAIRLELYYIAVEALNNVLKHSHAQNVTIRLEFGLFFCILEIYDNGRGFNPETDCLGGFGFASMKERSQKIGAKFQIKSFPGKGTHISVQVPTDSSRVTE